MAHFKRSFLQSHNSRKSNKNTNSNDFIWLALYQRQYSLILHIGSEFAVMTTPSWADSLRKKLWHLHQQSNYQKYTLLCEYAYKQVLITSCQQSQPTAALVAQWLEHWSSKPGVKSSILFWGLYFIFVY